MSFRPEICVVFVVLVASCGVQAACPTAVSPTCANIDCSGATLRRNVLAATPNAAVAADRFFTCYEVNNECCDDECVQYTSPKACAESNECSPVPNPGTSSGDPSAVIVNCVHRNKLCWMLTKDQCDTYDFCKFMQNGLCEFEKPAFSEGTAAPGESVADKCPGMHPMVI